MTLSIIHLELSIAHLFLDIYWVQLLSTIIILYNWLLYSFSSARTGMNYLFKQLEYRIKEESVLMVNVCWNPSKCLFHFVRNFRTMASKIKLCFWKTFFRFWKISVCLFMNNGWYRNYMWKSLVINISSSLSKWNVDFSAGLYSVEFLP